MSRRRRVAAAEPSRGGAGGRGASQGCADDLPDEGPIVTSEPLRPLAGFEDRRPSDINVTSPPRDASPLEVVRGFLDAMTASPIRLDVAPASTSPSGPPRSGSPAAAKITYADSPARRRVEGTAVTVRLTDAELIGPCRRPARPAAGGRRDRCAFTLELEDGQYRIANPRDALVVPTSWFAQRFRQVSLYYFDPTGSVPCPSRCSCRWGSSWPRR